jgi:pimeloyl-ACP methyl ester carboxylesterase
MITGGGGVRLHVLEAGDPKGRPIVFIHGFSQCSLAWTRQLTSTLADTFRLVSVDLRGHGLSDKPRDAYNDSKLWADDLRAIIQTLGLDHPVLCGWSYGPLVILDYLRHYGEEDVRGVSFVGGVTKLGSDEAVAVLSAGFLGLVPGFFSTDAEEGAHALESLVRMCFAGKLSAEERYLMLGYNLSVPHHVGQGLLSRSIDSDYLLL